LLSFAGIAFELTQPGFGFAGISGLVALAFAVYGMWAAPPGWLGLALLVAGTLLLISDVVTQRLGARSAVGMVGFVAGSFLLYRGVAPSIEIPLWLIVVGSAAAFWYYGFGLTIAQQAYRRIVNTQQGLVGMVGETRNDINPEGAVHVKGTLWRARTVGEHIPAGTRVRVRGVDGLVLRVEAEPDED
jgi:membrane-bound serine protease (ClpP class)